MDYIPFDTQYRCLILIIIDLQKDNEKSSVATMQQQNPETEVLPKFISRDMVIVMQF